MEYQNYDSIVFFVLATGFALSLWKAWRKYGFKAKAQADRKYERANQHTHEDLHEIVIKFPREERAEKAQQAMTKRIIDHVEQLKRLLRQEQDIAYEAKRLARGDHFEGKGGIEEGGVIKEVCEEEDRVIDRDLLPMFSQPQELAKRLHKAMHKEEKKMRHDLKDQDAKGKTAEEMEALDQGEEEEEGNVDQKGRDASNNAGIVANEEFEIARKFGDARTYLGDIKRVNDTIIKLSKATTKSEHKEHSVLSDIENLIDHKQHKLNHIIDCLKLIEQYEDEVIHHTERAWHDAQILTGA